MNGSGDASPAPEDRRAASRQASAIEAIASTDLLAWRVAVRNLSEAGLELETYVALETGATIQLDMPGLYTVTVRVVWSGHTACGCEFLFPLSEAAVRAVILYSRSRDPATCLVLPDSAEPDRTGRRISVSVAAAGLLFLLAAIGLTASFFSPALPF